MSEPNAQADPPAAGIPEPAAAPAPASAGWPPPGAAPAAWAPPPVAGPAAPAPYDAWGKAGPAWGAPVQPAHLQPGLLSRLDPKGWRVTILAALIMVGVVGGANLVNGVVPLPARAATSGDGGTTGPAQPGPVRPGDPLTVTAGVTFVAPDGWSVLSASDGQVVVGRGTAAMEVDAGPFTGVPADLEAAYRAKLLAPGDQASKPKQVTFGSGIPGLGVVYTKATDSGPIDGIYVVGAIGDEGVIFNLVAPQGDLATYQDDADTALGTVTVAGAR